MNSKSWCWFSKWFARNNLSPQRWPTNVLLGNLVCEG